MQDQSVRGPGKQHQCAEQVFAVFRQRGLQYKERRPGGHYSRNLGVLRKRNQHGIDAGYHLAGVACSMPPRTSRSLATVALARTEESEITPSPATRPTARRRPHAVQLKFMGWIKAYMQ